MRFERRHLFDVEFGRWNVVFCISVIFLGDGGIYIMRWRYGGKKYVYFALAPNGVEKLLPHSLT
jgi:hypothetical protein